MLVLVSAIALAVAWPGLPEVVPIHQNHAGNVDGWGHKRNLLILPLLNVVLVACTSFLACRPHLANFPGPLTEENREVMLTRMSWFLAAAGLFIAVLFGVLILDGIGWLPLRVGFWVGLVLAVLSLVLPIIIATVFTSSRAPKS